MKLTEIQPKPKTVAELFTRHPECWTQGVFFKDESDHELANADKATRCCLAGAIGFVHNYDVVCNPLFYRVYDFLHQSVSKFNDAPNRTVAEIIQLAQEAGV